VINAIHEKAAALGVVDVLIPSTDAYVTAVCYIGSKSLSHVLSCIERNKERLLAIGPASQGAQKQIITSVLEYWKDQPGIAVNIVDKLLNYAVITPMVVIEWALVDHLDSGKMLAESYIYEMVSTTVFKVTNRIRQIIAARNQHGLPAEQVQMLDDTLTKERADMRELFAVIDDALTGVATGANDAMIESFDGEEKEQEMLQSWGRRWLAVFRRKLAVEEA
ncbi:Nuclear cap-binding protein subunit 1, partial [Cryomyces antarcticus]